MRQKASKQGWGECTALERSGIAFVSALVGLPMLACDDHEPSPRTEAPAHQEVAKDRADLGHEASAPLKPVASQRAPTARTERPKRTAARPPREGLGPPSAPRLLPCAVLRGSDTAHAACRRTRPPSRRHTTCIARGRSLAKNPRTRGTTETRPPRTSAAAPRTTRAHPARTRRGALSPARTGRSPEADAGRRAWPGATRRAISKPRAHDASLQSHDVALSIACPGHFGPVPGHLRS